MAVTRICRISAEEEGENDGNDPNFGQPTGRHLSSTRGHPFEQKCTGTRAVRLINYKPFYVFDRGFVPFKMSCTTYAQDVLNCHASVIHDPLKISFETVVVRYSRSYQRFGVNRRKAFDVFFLIFFYWRL